MRNLLSKRSYRYVAALLVLLGCVVTPAFGQDLQEIDFSGAHISLAGPRSFYVRGLERGGERFSVVVSPTHGGSWAVQRVVEGEENIVPPATVLDLASVRRVDETTLAVDGIVVGGRVYSGTLRIGPDLSITPLGEFAAGNADSMHRGRRNSLAAAGLGLGPENKRLEQEAERLRNENEDLQAQNQRLSRIVEELRAENEYLKGEVDRLVSRVDELETQTEGAGNGKLLEEAKGITSRIDELSAELREVERRLAERMGTGARREETEELKRRIAELEAENARLMGEKLALQERILDRVAGGGFVNLMAPRLGRTLLDDFNDARIQLGNWSLSAEQAVQNDPEQYFAKLLLPAPQRTRPTLYRFHARSIDEEGWVGLGLHVFVEETGRTGYGLGRSLLVWFTRDPDVYRNRRTYLQVYRSDDDVNMARVADALISEPISQELEIEILFEPDNNYITIAVNGRDKLRYRTWFGIDEGTTVALRSLGRAEFRNLTVRTTE